MFESKLNKYKANGYVGLDGNSKVPREYIYDFYPFQGEGVGWTVVSGTTILSLTSDSVGISSSDISKWNTAFGWGDHRNGGYLTNITASNVNTALGYIPVNPSTLTTAIVPASTNRNYVTNAQLTVINNTSGTNTGDQDLSGLQPLLTFDTTPLNLSVNPVTSSGVKTYVDSRTNVGEINFFVKNENRVLTTGFKGYVVIPYNGTITGWTILTTDNGSIGLDVWKCTYSEFPLSVSHSITGGSKPYMNGVLKLTSTDVSDWETSVLAGDIIGINIDSISIIREINFTININK